MRYPPIMRPAPRFVLLGSLLVSLPLAACKDFPAPPVESLTQVYDCEQPEPCGIFSAPSGDPGRAPPTDYDAAQRCVLEGLAAGEAMLIHYNDGCEGMCYGSALLTRSDGSVLVQPYAETFEGGIDFDGIRVEFSDWEQSEACELVDTSFFEACLASFDEACLRESNWLMDCGPVGEPSCGA